MSLVWSFPMKSHSEKLILLKLADCASDEGVCWPSWARISDETGCSRATIARAVLGFERAGLVSRQRRSGKTPMYHISEYALRGSHGDTGGSHGETPTRLMVRPDPSHGETLIIREPSEGTISSSAEDAEGKEKEANGFKKALEAWQGALGTPCPAPGRLRKALRPLWALYEEGDVCNKLSLYLETQMEKKEAKFISPERFVMLYNTLQPAVRRWRPVQQTAGSAESQ